MPQFNELDLLIYGYLNEDFDLICHTDSLEGAIDYYVTDVSENTLKALLKELNDFEQTYDANRDEEFENLFMSGVDYISVDHLFGLIRSTIKKNYPDLIEGA